MTSKALPVIIFGWLSNINESVAMRQEANTNGTRHDANRSGISGNWENTR